MSPRPSSGPPARRAPSGAARSGTPPSRGRTGADAGRSGPGGRTSGSGKGRNEGGGATSGASRSGSGRPSAPGRGRPKRDDEIRRPGWGGVARKGGEVVVGRREGRAYRRVDADGEEVRPAAPEPSDEWIDEGVIDDDAGQAGAGAGPRGSGRGDSVERSGATPRGSRAERRQRAELIQELSRFATPRRAERGAGILTQAAAEFAAERYGEARRLLRPLANELSEAPAVRELYGLTLYRLGRWRDAVTELEEVVRLTNGSTDQHPVLADAHRALRHYARVEELWDELRADSPSADLVTEGRIVAAGALADQGRLGDAVRLLERGWKVPKTFKEHHLRRAYALADLYERSGEVPRARGLFEVVARQDPDFADAPQRAASLR